MDLAEERKLFSQGFEIIGAIDEAGRGPLAGPVVAACVIIKANISVNNDLLKIKDSKKISAKKREKFYDLIKENFLETGIGVCDHKTIDRINILQATFLAMKKALGIIKSKPQIILIDGSLAIPNCTLRQQTYIKGDEKIFSIAAASIIAKVTRDRLMAEIHNQFPNYNFIKHKGYGTAEHLARLRQYGPSPVHRLSFGRVILRGEK